jgi:hypothetical protein
VGIVGGMIRGALVLAVVFACTPAGSGGEVAEEDPVVAWRRTLADPAAFAIRDGMKVDEGALMAAMSRGRAAHRERLARRWEAELRALGEVAAPREPEYRTVMTIRVAELGTRETEGMTQLADSGLRATLGRTLGMYLPISMMQELGMTTADVGGWMAFFAMAEPEVARCGDALCMSYGGLDVLVCSLGQHDGTAVVETIRWMQRATPR